MVEKYVEQIDEDRNVARHPSDNVKNKLVKFEFQYIEEPAPSMPTSPKNTVGGTYGSNFMPFQLSDFRMDNVLNDSMVSEIGSKRSSSPPAF